MSIITIESMFEYQAKEVLLRALKGQGVKNLNDVEEFQDEVWGNKMLLEEIGRKFIEALGEFNGDETFEEVMEQLAENQGENEEDED